MRTRIDGIPLTIEPGVFHPGLFFSTRILVNFLKGVRVRGRTFLDMGTGSGAVGVWAACAGAHVLALDINPVAVQCARANAARLGLNARFESRESDLFKAVGQGEQFDMIVWNPPFYPQTAANAGTAAWYAGDGYSSLRRFALESPPFLAAEGVLIIILSSDMDDREVITFFREAGYALRTTSTIPSIFEWFIICEFRHPQGTVRH